jgi:hypothetical protein
MPGELRWIYTHDSIPTPTDEQNHGSCVLSKAVSPMFGTAKNANMVMVKAQVMQTLTTNEVILNEKYFLEGLYSILDDVRGRGLQGTAVVNLSLGCKYKVLKTQFTYKYLLMYVE